MKTGLCGLYCFKNKAGEIIYIGKADDIHKRLKHHKHLSEECYAELNSVEYAIIDNKADRDILELLLITKLHPKYNTQLKYTEEPTLLIDSSVMLFWQKASIDEYDFIHQHQIYLNHKTNSDIIGRPKIDIQDKFIEIYPKWKNGELTAVQCFKDILKISKSTFYRRVREYEATLNINN